MTASLAEFGMRGADGLPYLKPEIQLFYKAKAPRSKDEIDFAATLPILSPARRAWLRDAIATAYGPSTPWLAALAACGG